MNNLKALLVKKSIRRVTLLAFFLMLAVGVKMLFAAYSAGNIVGQTDGSNGADYVSSSVDDGIIGTGRYIALSPKGILEADSYIFVADSSNNRILVYQGDGNGSVDDHLADFVIGQTNFTASSAARTASTLDGPNGLAYDSVNALLWAVDTGNNRVLGYDINSIEGLITGGGVISASYVLGQDNFTSNSAATTATGLDSPYGVVFDANTGYLYVADTGNNRVLAYNLGDGVVDGEAAADVLGQDNFTSGTSGGPTTEDGDDMSDEFNGPQGVAVSSSDGLLFVSEAHNNRVVAFNIADGIDDGDSEVAINVYGQPDLDSMTSDGCDLSTTVNPDRDFCIPDGLAVNDVSKLLYVVDSNNDRVLKFSINSGDTYPQATGVLGHSNFTGTAVDVEGSFNSPSFATLSVTDPGLLYVSDTNNHRTLVFDVATLTDGENADDVLGQLQEGEVLFNGTSYPAEAPALRITNDTGLNTDSGTPPFTALDLEQNRLFVSDTDNNRVLVFNLASGVVVNRTADIVLGQQNMYTNDTGVTAQTMNAPTALAYDPNNLLLYVADSGNRRVLVFDARVNDELEDPVLTTGDAAVNVLGQDDFTSNSASLDEGGMNAPFGLALNGEVDADGVFLYVADQGYNRVLIFDVSVLENGESAVNVLGQANFGVSTSGNGQAQMSGPYGLEYFEDQDLLFVADSGNNRILSYDVSAVTDGENAANVLGQAGFGTSAAATTAAGLRRPTGLDVMANNHILYVSDTNNHRIVGYDIESITNGEAAITVFGQDNFTTLTAGASQTKVTYPFGLTVDSTNNRIYVSDSQNNRVLIYSLPTISSVTLDRYSGFAITPSSSQGTLGNAEFFASFGAANDNDDEYLPAGLSDIGTSAEGFSFLNRAYRVITRLAYSLSGLNFYTEKEVSSLTQSDDSALGNNADDGYESSQVLAGAAFNAAEDVIIDYEHHRLYYSSPETQTIYGYDLTSNDELTDTTSDYRFGDPELNSTGGTTQNQLWNPTALAYDPTGDLLFVADTTNHRVVVYEHADITGSGPNATYVLGQPDFTTRTPDVSVAKMRFPAGLAVDSTNRRLFVSDTGNHRVLVYDITAITNGEDAAYVLGQADFASRTPTYDSTTGMSSPKDLEYNPNTDYLYVINYGNSSESQNIQVFDVASISNNEASVERTYTPDDGEFGDGTPTVTGLALDTENDRLIAGLYNAGSNENQIWMFKEGSTWSTSGTNTEDSACIGTDGACSIAGLNGSQGKSTSHFGAPRGMHFDPSSRRLFVIDYPNDRLMEFEFVKIDQSSLPSGTVDSAYSQTLTTSQDQNTVTFDLVSGSLPTGLSFDENTGALTGTPTVAGAYSFTIEATDMHPTYNWPNFPDSQSFTLTIAAAASFQCSDSADNDNDGLIDYPSDPGCADANDDNESNGGGGNTTNRCEDNRDNDGDGLIDYPDDPGCSNNNDNNETSACDDNIDNDGDGLTDHPDDPGCGSIGDNTEDATVTPGTFECSDGDDNDNDNLIDMNDSGCSSSTDDSEATIPSNTLPQCSNGLDDDLDGRTDMSDPGCSLATDDNEYNAPAPVTYQCSDGIDNDGDRFIDMVDDGCSSSTDNTEKIYECSNTSDDDNDGLVDGDDPGCSGATDDNEYDAPIVPPEEEEIPIPGEEPVIPSEENPVPNEEDPAAQPNENESPNMVQGNGSECFRVLSGDASAFDIVKNQVRGTYCVTEENVMQTIDYVEILLNETNGNALAKIIGVTGLIMGAIFSILPYLFLTPFSFSEVALLPYRLWSLLMSALGLKKRVRAWGTVYDSITKQPLDPAVVQLQDVEGREVAVSTTDIDGRYGFLVSPGKYRLLPKKTNYSFPSLKLINKTRDELYLDLYFGYVFEVTREGEVITKNIPMDPDNFDWNEFAKREQKKMKFFSKRDFIINKIADVFFSIGFTVAIIALVSAPKTYNIVIFGLYIVMAILREVGLRYNSFGNVKDKEGNPLSFAIVRVFSGPTEILHKVTNKTGRFYALLQNGTYTVTVEKKNEDESYTKIYEGMHEVKKGVLGGTITV